MIFEITGGAPRVEIHRGKVAIWEADPEEGQIGFLMDNPTTYTVAVRMLAALAKIKGDTEYAMPVSQVEAVARRLDDGEHVIALHFTVEGLTVTMDLDLIRFAELTAGLAEMSRLMDRGANPKPDRR